jgi:hypothetical protein
MSVFGRTNQLLNVDLWMTQTSRRGKQRVAPCGVFPSPGEGMTGGAGFTDSNIAAALDDLGM